MHEGLVPELEAREAAAFVHLSWQGFRDLPRDEQTAAIAHYRMHAVIESNSSDAVEAAAERRMAAN